MANHSAFNEGLSSASIAIWQAIDVETSISELAVASSAFEAVLMVKISVPIDHRTLGRLGALGAIGTHVDRHHGLFLGLS